MTFFFICVAITSILFASTYLTVEWLIHLEMMNYRIGSGEIKKIGWASYKDFVREFSKYDNWDTRTWSNSLFDSNNDCYLHAGIIKFNGIGMKIKDPISWYRVNRYIKRYIKESKMEYYDWSKSE